MNYPTLTAGHTIPIGPYTTSDGQKMQLWGSGNWLYSVFPRKGIKLLISYTDIFATPILLNITRATSHLNRKILPHPLTGNKHIHDLIHSHNYWQCVLSEGDDTIYRVRGDAAHILCVVRKTFSEFKDHYIFHNFTRLLHGKKYCLCVSFIFN